MRSSVPNSKAIRSFVLLTSVRLEEAISLKWSNVDFERGIVTLVQKGERHREIPMTEEIRSLLRSLHGRHPEAVFTFVARKTRRDPHTGEMLIAGNVYPWSYWGVKSAERRDWAKAGLKVKGSRSYASFHDLRRTAARDQYDAAGVYAARDLLGHANVKTTQADCRTGVIRMRGDDLRGHESAGRKGGRRKRCGPASNDCRERRYILNVHMISRQRQGCIAVLDSMPNSATPLEMV